MLLFRSFMTAACLLVAANSAMGQLSDRIDWLHNPSMVSLGGKVLASTTDMPNIYNAGGAFTLGMEWDPIYTCTEWDAPIVVSPIFNWDIGGMGTMPNMQLDDAPDYRLSDGFFFTAFQPGFRLRKPLHEDANCYLQFGLDIRYASTEFTNTVFDPMMEQILVDAWIDEDWSAGYFAGGGIEHTWNDHIVRMGVNFESYGSRLMTGYKHQESQVAIVMEIIHGR